MIDPLRMKFLVIIFKNGGMENEIHQTSLPCIIKWDKIVKDRL